VARITATGHTDISGSAAYNLALSERRAAMVAEELIRQGVPARDIVTIGRGEEGRPACSNPGWGP
jgi:OOP family OmpA-OmpF porin